ncbi:hypothetical protein ACFVXE_05405 [Streptomyces sp. NPDC058231]|uniref:hypothetical protein n=1 Tax=Streptomyces sp. NPDC058231 TaxID=3346392 RepID=UPI0036E5B5B6
MNASRRPLAAVAAVVLMTLVSGCSSDAASSNEDHGGGRAAAPDKPRAVPGVGKVEKKSDTDTLTLPIDAYDVSMSQIVKTQLAQNALVVDCLSRYGLTVEYPKATVNTGSPHARRYGPPESLEAARKYGFHMAQGDPRAASGTKMVRHPADVLDVMDGMKRDGSGTLVTSFRGQAVPKGGCVGEAQRKLSAGEPKGTRSGHADMAAAIKARSFEVAKNDPRVIKAEQKWATCMSGKGFTHYKESFAAAGDTRWNTPKATSAEITVAVASWNCGKEANVVGTWVAVETAYQNDQIDKNAETLKEEQKRLVEENKRIDAIIARTGGAAS